MGLDSEINVQTTLHNKSGARSPPHNCCKMPHPPYKPHSAYMTTLDVLQRAQHTGPLLLRHCNGQHPTCRTPLTDCRQREAIAATTQKPWKHTQHHAAMHSYCGRPRQLPAHKVSTRVAVFDGCRPASATRGCKFLTHNTQGGTVPCRVYAMKHGSLSHCAHRDGRLLSQARHAHMLKETYSKLLPCVLPHKPPGQDNPSPDVKSQVMVHCGVPHKLLTALVLCPKSARVCWHARMLSTPCTPTPGCAAAAAAAAQH